MIVDPIAIAPWFATRSARVAMAGTGQNELIVRADASRIFLAICRQVGGAGTLALSPFGNPTSGAFVNLGGGQNLLVNYRDWAVLTSYEWYGSIPGPGTVLGIFEVLYRPSIMGEVQADVEQSYDKFFHLLENQ